MMCVCVCMYIFPIAEKYDRVIQKGFSRKNILEYNLGEEKRII